MAILQQEQHCYQYDLYCMHLSTPQEPFLTHFPCLPALPAPSLLFVLQL
jgi:hypothetical protein